MKPLDPSSGNPAALAHERASEVAGIFREHNRTLVGFLVARLRDEQEAKEVAQEAYVRVLQLEPQDGAVSYLRAYLFRTAENLAKDRLRQRISRGRIDQLDSLDDFLEDARAERAAIAEQELALLRVAVAELPARCREAFRLHKLEDRPLSEVAVLMCISERMVRKFITRALLYVRLRREGHSAAQARALQKRVHGSDRESAAEGLPS